MMCLCGNCCCCCLGVVICWSVGVFWGLLLCVICVWLR